MTSNENFFSSSFYIKTPVAMGTTGAKGEEDAEMMGHVSYPMKKLHDRNRFQSGDLLLQSTK